MPKRCIQTNEPIGQDDWIKEKKLQWSPKWAGLCTSLPYLSLILLQKWLPHTFKDLLSLGMAVMMFGSVAVAVVLRKTCFVTYSLKSSVHRKKRRARLILALLMGLAGAAVLLCAFMDHYFWVPIVIAGAVSIAAVILGRASVQLLQVIRHRDGEFWLKGCSSEFLDSLDEA